MANEQETELLTDVQIVEQTLQERIEEKNALSKDLYFLKQEVVNLINLLPTHNSTKNISTEESAKNATVLNDTLESLGFDELLERLFLVNDGIQEDIDARKLRIGTLQERNKADERRISSLEQVAKGLMFMSGRNQAGGVEAQRVLKSKPAVYKIVNEDKIPEIYKETPPPKVLKKDLNKAIKDGTIKPEDVGVEVVTGGMTLAKPPNRK